MLGSVYMIKRNDPCICGSGKKYKKCCQLKEVKTVEAVMNEEIEFILQSFYSTYPERKDIRDYILLVQEWSPVLEGSLQRELIEAIVLDEFFFQKRPDIWEGYLKRQMKKIVRPSTLALLTKWKEPTLFVGQVQKIEDHYITVKHTFTDKVYKIRRENNKPIPDDMYLFAFLLDDGTDVEDQMLAISTLIFFPSEHKDTFVKIRAAYDASGKTAVDYLRENHLNVWKQLVDNGYKGEEFTTFESEVLQLTTGFLAEKNAESAEFIEKLQDYLVDEKPAARKAAAIAAGAIRFAQESGLIEKAHTVKEIAEYFGVSSSSLNKYYQELMAYHEAA